MPVFDGQPSSSSVNSEPPNPKPPRTPGLSSISHGGINKVLHGRVTKPNHAEVAVTATKYKSLVRSDKDSGTGAEKDAGFKSLLGVTTHDDYVDEIDGADCKLEESDQEEKEDSDNLEAPTIGTPLARQAIPENTVRDSTESRDGRDKAWRWEQIYLNTILNARNAFTLMPSTWKMHFRGIPLPDSLFYIKTRPKSIRPRIYAYTDRFEYRGALALRRLIDVHGRIQDIRDDESAVKGDASVNRAEKRELIRAMSIDMARQLRRALEQALDWAKQDGEIDKYGDQLPPNVRIMELKVITATDEPESEVKIQEEMCSLAEEWRTHVSNGGSSFKAPVIFGFVIMKHIITIVTLDGSDPDAIIHVPCQLHMAERNQHQWNALAILVTICWARDVLLDHINARPDLQPEVKSESSDPDA